MLCFLLLLAVPHNHAATQPHSHAATVQKHPRTCAHRAYLEAHGATKRDIQDLNNRTLSMPRCDGAHIPWCNGQYFSEHSRVQATEHRTMVQFAPHTTNGMDPELCELMCA